MTSLPPLRQSGISLVELLVGMAIGLMAILVVTHLFLISEEQRRTPTSAANTHINGILALTALQRDLRQAGYGISNDALLGCRIAASTSSSAIGLADAAVGPVVIQAGTGSTASDSIRVLSSNVVDAAVPIQTAAEHAANSGEFVIAAAPGLQVRDWLLLAPTNSSQCHVFQVTSIAHSGATSTLRYSADAAIDQQVPAGSLMVNLGQSPTHRNWSVSSLHQLQATDFATADQAIDAFSDVVLIRALYAKDTSGNGSIDTYDWDAPNTPAQWAQVLGVRIAIVARSPQRSKEPVTTAALQWDIGSVSAPNSIACSHDASSQCLRLDVSASDDDWGDFRYRLFDTLVPLRNLLWSGNV